MGCVFSLRCLGRGKAGFTEYSNTPIKARHYKWNEYRKLLF
jgi:hypothetical protein